MTAVDYVIFAELVAIFVPIAAFTIGYARRPWHRTWEGRALLTSGVGLTLLSGGLLVDQIGDVPDGVWVGVGAIVAMGAWLKLTLLVLDWRERHRA